MSAVLLVAANDRFGLAAFHLQHSRLLLEISLTYAPRYHVFNVIETYFSDEVCYSSARFLTANRP